LIGHGAALGAGATRADKKRIIKLMNYF